MPHASSASRTGIIIPLYVYPGKSWERVADIRRANVGVPIVAVINPASGPGTRRDPNYASGITALRSAGVKVLGYVATGYGALSLSEVESLVGQYNDWYPLDGIFFDEMSNVAGREGYYAVLYAHARSLGFAFVVGNPGTRTTERFLRTLDTLVVYEGRGLPDVSYLESSCVGMPKSSFAVVAYGVKNVSASYAIAASQRVGYVYATNGELPNPYGALPPYLEELTVMLQQDEAKTRLGIGVPRS